MKKVFGLVVSSIAAALFVLVAVVFWWLSSPPLDAYGIDIEQTSVSGVSSGGAMAVQMHIAHSSIMRGVGVTAGVAYDCADSGLLLEPQRVAHGLSCVEGSVDAAFSIARTTAAAGTPGAIDDPETHLPDQKVWLFSGYNDGSVRRAAMDALAAYYANYVDPGNVFYKTNNKAPHALITANYGATCLSFGGDFINNCNYESAGRLLTHIYGRLNAPSTDGLSGSILEFDQGQFVDGNPRTVGLADTGYVYVPLACQTDTCQAHVVFHGCQQYAGRVGSAVYQHAGYNEWADTNKLIVLYPQTVASTGAWPSGGPFNPKGCWDWWGYSEPSEFRRDYARKTGYQIKAIKAMLDRLAENFQPPQGPSDTFGAPQHFSAPDSTPTSADLIWQPNSAAAGFNVYRSLTEAGPFTKINGAPVLGASFADQSLEPSITYHYQLSAIEQGSDTESPRTSPITVTTSPNPPACNPFFSNNITHVAMGRAYIWGTDTFAMGTGEPMGSYSADVFAHLIKQGFLNYRVGFCP